MRVFGSWRRGPVLNRLNLGVQLKSRMKGVILGVRNGPFWAVLGVQFGPFWGRFRGPEIVSNRGPEVHFAVSPGPSGPKCGVEIAKLREKSEPVCAPYFRPRKSEPDYTFVRSAARGNSTCFWGPFSAARTSLGELGTLTMWRFSEITEIRVARTSRGTITLTLTLMLCE